MPKISIILETARGDYPLVDLPETHLFERTLDSLGKQVFKDFELVVVDVLYNKRLNCFEGDPFDRKDYSFPIKHLDQGPFHWLERKRWSGNHGFNIGIVHSDGELLVFAGDCCEFPPSCLWRVWNWYLRGYWANILAVYRRGGEPLILEAALEEAEKIKGEKEARKSICDDSKLKVLYKPGELVCDSRFRFLDEDTGLFFPTGQQVAGYNAVPLKVALEVNGQDENFDGEKPLGDADFGMRIEQAGHRGHYICDRLLQVIEHWHGYISSDVIDGIKPTFKSNYPLLLLNQKKGYWRANSRLLTEEEIEWILKEEEKWCEGCDLGGEEWQYWLESQKLRIFDLQSLWMRRKRGLSVEWPPPTLEG